MQKWRKEGGKRANWGSKEEINEGVRERERERERKSKLITKVGINCRN